MTEAESAGKNKSPYNDMGKNKSPTYPRILKTRYMKEIYTINIDVSPTNIGASFITS